MPERSSWPVGKRAAAREGHWSITRPGTSVMTELSKEPLASAVAVVTGGGSGIGRAIATALSQTNGQVIVVERDRSRRRSTIADLEGSGARGCWVSADLATTRGVLSAIRAIERQCQAIDILVHCAGVFESEPMEASAFDALFATNVRAPWLLTRRLLPLLERRGGQVVFVNSSAAFSTSQGLGPYSASKAALRMVADAFRAEVNASGIRVLTICPGRTATPMQKRIHNMEGKVYLPKSLLQPEDISSAVLAALGLPRTAEVTDLSIRPFQKPGIPAEGRQTRRPKAIVR